MGALQKCLQYNEHNVPVWPNEIFLYLSLNISCSLNLRVFIVPRSQLIFWNRLCVTSSICYRLPQHGGYWIDVASITAFVVFPPLEHGVRFTHATDTCTTHVWFFRMQTYRFHPALLRSGWSGFLREDVSIHLTNLKYCGKSPKIRFHFICSFSSKILRIIVNLSTHV